MWMATAFRLLTLELKLPFESTVMVEPVHEPPFLAPSMTLQYVPAGRPVWKVELQSWSVLLMTTNPAVPRPKATRWGVGEIQLVISAVWTAFLKPTIPEMAVQRCWQYQPLVPALPLQEPEFPFGAPESPLLNW